MLATALTSEYVFQSNRDVERVLVDFDGYIRSLVGRKVPRALMPRETLNMEVEDIIQNVRIKLWQALQRREISNFGAYIRCIVHTECVNMVRGYKSLLSLPINEEGELYQGKVLMTPSQGMQDPACEFECQEAVVDWMVEIVDAVLALPQQQRHAMLAVLKDCSRDVLPLAEVLIDRGVDIEAIHWPKEKEGLHKLRVSCSIARRKLRALKKKDRVEHP